MFHRIYRSVPDKVIEFDTADLREQAETARLETLARAEQMQQALKLYQSCLLELDLPVSDAAHLGRAATATSAHSKMTAAWSELVASEKRRNELLSRVVRQQSMREAAQRRKESVNAYRHLPEENCRKYGAAVAPMVFADVSEVNSENLPAESALAKNEVRCPTNLLKSPKNIILTPHDPRVQPDAAMGDPASIDYDIFTTTHSQSGDDGLCNSVAKDAPRRSASDSDLDLRESYCTVKQDYRACDAHFLNVKSNAVVKVKSEGTLINGVESVYCWKRTNLGRKKYGYIPATLLSPRSPPYTPRHREDDVTPTPAMTSRSDDIMPAPLVTSYSDTAIQQAC